MNGAKIDVKMSATPNPQRGTQEEDLPYSFTKELANQK
jgi:putative alpha-1,2-mannosidase